MNDIWEKKERMDKKEDIKKIIDTSTNYDDLCNKSVEVLQKMESAFQDSLCDIADKNRWDSDKRRAIWNTRFDEILDTDDPLTIFEKKWAEILKKSQDISVDLGALNAWIQVAESIWSQELDQISKDNMVDELFKTRLEAIQNFEDDISDGILSNINNVDFRAARYVGVDLWDDIFKKHNKYDKATFEKYIDTMPLPKLILWTFNTEDWSWAFEDCLRKVKQKLWGQSLFDYIDSQQKWDQTREILKYSSMRMLLKRKKTSDLIDWIKWYKWDQQELLQYIEDETLYDTSFTVCFLSSIDDLEKNTDFDWFFGKLAAKIKEDPKVQQAYENASKVENADVFNSWVINALAIYDDDVDWWGWNYFWFDLKSYQNNRWFVINEKINNPNYIKYILKKGEDTITLVKLKSKKKEDEDYSHLHEENVENSLSEITNWVDYNLFALRGHCYNTRTMAYTLWWLNAVQENDIFIDGWCFGAWRVWDYYANWIRGQIFAYNWTWKWDSTQSFINKIFDNKSDPQGFRKILDYYNSYTKESWADGHFAYHVERPDSVASQYKRLLAYERYKEYENYAHSWNWDTANPEQESTVQEIDIDNSIGSLSTPEIQAPISQDDL